MRLIRFEIEGSRRHGLVRDDEIIAFDEHLASAYPNMTAFIEGGAPALARARSFAASAPATCKLSQARLLAPIERPGKYLAIDRKSVV